MSILNKLFGKQKHTLRSVPGAGVYKDGKGKVVYNLLDPWMAKFMGQCIGVIKKEDIPAKGTGQFSLLLGENQQVELQLDKFWKKYIKSQNQSVFEEVAKAATVLYEKNNANKASKRTASTRSA